MRERAVLICDSRMQWRMPAITRMSQSRSCGDAWPVARHAGARAVPATNPSLPPLIHQTARYGNQNQDQVNRRPRPTKGRSARLAGARRKGFGTQKMTQNGTKRAPHGTRRGAKSVPEPNAASFVGWLLSTTKRFTAPNSPGWLQLEGFGRRLEAFWRRSEGSGRPPGSILGALEAVLEAS